MQILFSPHGVLFGQGEWSVYHLPSAVLQYICAQFFAYWKSTNSSNSIGNTHINDFRTRNKPIFIIQSSLPVVWLLYQSFLVTILGIVSMARTVFCCIQIYMTTVSSETLASVSIWLEVSYGKVEKVTESFNDLDFDIINFIIFLLQKMVECMLRTHWKRPHLAQWNWHEDIASGLWVHRTSRISIMYGTQPKHVYLINNNVKNQATRNLHMANFMGSYKWCAQKTIFNNYTSTRSAHRSQCTNAVYTLFGVHVGIYFRSIKAKSIS